MKTLATLTLMAMVLTASVVRANPSPVGKTLLMGEAPASLTPSLSQFVFSSLAQDDDEAVAIESVETKGDAPRRWWPVLLSAAVPGLGELSTGYWKRGAPMVALDAWLITSLLDHRDKGNQLEDEYRAFADTHYSEEEWTIALNDGDLEDYFSDLTPGSQPEDVDLYVTREADEREWYENIGKWDQFAWGWEEYWMDDFDPGPANNPNFMTPLRQNYVDLREESNSEIGKANARGGISLLLRIFSILQTAYLEGFVGARYRHQGPGLNEPGQVSLLTHSDRQSSSIGVSVTY